MALENAHWPQGFVCPARSSSSFCRVMHGRVKTFQCNRCHKQVTLTGGSIFHSTKLPLTLWFQAMFFLSQNKTGISTLELMRLIGVSYRSAWRMKHKLMQVMCERERSRATRPPGQRSMTRTWAANAPAARADGDRKTKCLLASVVDSLGGHVNHE